MHRVTTLAFLAALAATTASAQWTTSIRGAAFGIHDTEAGPKNGESKTFSTNWLEVSTAHSFANGFFIGLRGRGSAEPYTIPREGYPQLLQQISPEAGGPLSDHMRARDLIEEAAVEAGWKALHIYAAPIGEPTLGEVPYGPRESSLDLAVAPFAYDVQESFHVQTRVVNAGLWSKYATLEGGVFHNSVSTGRHTTIDGGSIDSWAARLVVRPTTSTHLQVSRGKLGDADVQVTSASFGYDNGGLSLAAIYTKRDDRVRTPLDALGAEIELRGARGALAGRFERVGRYETGNTMRRTGHATLGYTFDIFPTAAYRTGLGINIDYHQNTKQLDRNVYGHKPQTVYLFLRVRGNRGRTL